MDFFVLNFQKFMLVFVRIMGMIFVDPIFGSQTVSGRVKLGLVLFISIVVFPMAQPFLVQVPSDMISYGLLALMEGMIGVIIGFCINIAFSAYQLAGQFFEVQMGFGASEVFDPLSEISLPLVGQFLYLIGILVYLTINGPLFALREVFYSFEFVSAANFIHYAAIESNYGLITQFIYMFQIALRIALPIAGVLLLVSIAMGLLAKAAPQMDLLMIGFPISITVGFIILMILLPAMVVFFKDYIDEVFKNIWFLMMELSNA